MKNWDDLRFLLALSKTGSMAASAELLETNAGTVSRRIARLADTMGYDPFVRTPTGWRPNDRSLALLQDVEWFDGQLTTHENLSAIDDQRPVTLTIGSPPALSHFVFSGGLHDLRRQHPFLTLQFKDRILQTGLGANDIIVTSLRPDRGRLIVRPLRQMHFGLYGFADAPEKGDWVGVSGHHDGYPAIAAATEFFGASPAIRMESFVGAYFAMRTSRLPGLLPRVVAQEDPSLRPIGPEDLTGMCVDLFACYHETRRRDPAVAAAVAWMTDVVTKTTAL